MFSIRWKPSRLLIVLHASMFIILFYVVFHSRHSKLDVIVVEDRKKLQKLLNLTVILQLPPPLFHPSFTPTTLPSTLHNRHFSIQPPPSFMFSLQSFYFFQLFNTSQNHFQLFHYLPSPPSITNITTHHHHPPSPPSPPSMTTHHQHPPLPPSITTLIFLYFHHFWKEVVWLC